MSVLLAASVLPVAAAPDEDPVLVAEAGTPDAKVTITPSHGAKAYRAYRLLDLTTSAKADGGYNYAYTLNEAYGNVLKAAMMKVAGGTGDVTGDNLFDHRDVIAHLDGADADKVRAFADAVYEAILADEALIGGDVAGGITETEGAFSFTGKQGYYLIAEAETAEDPDAYSLVMLDTLGQEDVTVTSKESVPEVDKFLVDAEEVKAGDYALGDTVTFVLTGTVAENLMSFENPYSYSFEDTLDDGITLDSSSIKVYLVSDNDGLQASDLTKEALAAITGAENCDVTDAFAVAGSDSSFGIGITDLRELFQDGNRQVSPADALLIVTYEGTINSNAVDMEQNTVKISFSNDPYHQDSTSETPEEKVKVYTYRLTVNKTDGTVPLAGASFKLQKKGEDGTYADYRLTADATTETNPTTFVFSQLDAGSYRLVETKVPDGYAKAEDIDFEITRTFEDVEGEKVPVLVSSNTEVPVSGFGLSTEVINVAGSKLPSTGGAGLMLLYVVAGCAAVGGIAVVIVTLRAAKKKEQ